MKQFRAMNKLKKLALKVKLKISRSIRKDNKRNLKKYLNFFWFKVIAENLSEDEIKGLKQMFKNMDTDGSGTITFDELRTGLHRLGSKLTESEIKQLMEAVSKIKNTNPICYIYSN